MKIKIPRTCLVIVMLMTGFIFAFSIAEQGNIPLGAFCLLLIICGICIHCAVVQEGDCSDYDVIG